MALLKCSCCSLLQSNTFKPTYDEWMANEEAAMKALKL
jgi:hypothetical protein